MKTQSMIEAKSSSEENFQKAIAALSKELIEKEEYFLENFKISKVGPLKQLEMIYELTDKLFSSIYNFTPCKKGCSCCCYYTIHISETEISYIEKNKRIKRKNNFAPIRELHDTPCPFLQKDKCLIYDYRPFSCRKHITLAKDSSFCAPEFSSEVALKKISFSNIEQAFFLLQERTGVVKFYDIRQVVSRISSIS